MPITRVLAFLLFSFLLAGCHAKVVEPVIRVKSRTLVVVPLSDRTRGHFESTTGMEVARVTTSVLADHAEDEDYSVVPYKTLEDRLSELDPRTLEFVDIGKKTDADTVIVGEMTRFETRQAGDIGIFRGLAHVRLRVYDLTKDGEVAHESEFEARFPVGYYTTGTVGATEMSEEEVRRGLIKSTALKLAQHFYEHEDEGDPKSEAW